MVALVYSPQRRAHCFVQNHVQDPWHLSDQAAFPSDQEVETLFVSASQRDLEMFALLGQVLDCVAHVPMLQTFP